jgi:23S rRNA (adenine2030-N6)-methyltransferase
MLSYQHIYHAGSFADVHKHALLAHCLAALKAKHPRLTVLDTHAGRGLYDFSAPEALKKQEYQNGIAHFMGNHDAALRPYLDIVRKYNQGEGLEFYPGSAVIARDMLRPSDRMILSELHPGEFQKLEETFEGGLNVELLKADGLDVLMRRMPPQDMRGMAVIDPSFEMKTDYAEIPRKLAATWRKWTQGVFFLWYPILESAPHLSMLTALRETDVRDVLVSEIKLAQTPEQGYAMYGSGVAIINPPVQEAAVHAIMDSICAGLPQAASHDLFWLANTRIDPDTKQIAI